VVYASDPRTDLETLHHPELIVLDGRVIQAPAGAAAPRPASG